MNILVYLFALVCVPTLAGLAWMAKRPLLEETSADPGDKIEDLLPLHTQHFPQLRQSLDSTDERYIGPKLSKDTKRLWCEERAKIVESFLRGLAGDFGRVIRLARVVDSLAPNSARPNGMERYWLALRFRLRYRILWWWISGGRPMAIRQLGRLTDTLGSLSALAEAAMLRLESADDEPEMRSNISV